MVPRGPLPAGHLPFQPLRGTHPPYALRLQRVGCRGPDARPGPIVHSHQGNSLLRVGASCPGSDSPLNELAKTGQGTTEPMAGPWAWSSRDGLPAITQPIEQQISSRFQADGRDSREASAVQQPSSPPRRRARPAEVGPWAPVQGTGQAGASGLRNQAPSALGLPEPKEHPVLQHLRGLPGSGAGRGAVPQVASRAVRVLGGLHRASLAGSEVRRAAGVAVGTGTWQFWGWMGKVAPGAGKAKTLARF